MVTKRAFCVHFVHKALFLCYREGVKKSGEGIMCRRFPPTASVGRRLQPRKLLHHAGNPLVDVYAAARVAART